MGFQLPELGGTDTLCLNLYSLLMSEQLKLIETFPKCEDAETSAEDVYSNCPRSDWQCRGFHNQIDPQSKVSA